MTANSECVRSSEHGKLSKKLHELSHEELNEYRVCEQSKFSDDKWVFFNHIPGAAKANSTLNWAMVLSDGSQLTEAHHAERLHWAKLLLLTLIVIPANGRIRATGSMSNLQTSFNYLLSRMSEVGYHDPHELTPQVVKCFMEHIAPIMAARCVDAELSRHAFARGLFVVSQLWSQRHSLSRMGVKPMVAHPFDGKNSEQISRELSIKVSNLIPPLPDEVALPLLNKAAWFLGTPANDVLRLMNVFTDPLAGSMVTVKSTFRSTYTHKAGLTNCSRHRRVRRFLDKFEFGIVAGERQPWHEPISFGGKESSSEYDGKRQAAHLWEAVRDAAAIIVQAMSGMRASELLSIRAGIDQDTGL
ncbi:MAG: hypothetical protein Q7J29_12205, partial [Stagnimonas sp.]|nr:hypothetical protein [Stagnimonas sp.]